MARVAQTQHVARPQMRAMSQTFSAWASLGSFFWGFFFRIKAHLQILVEVTPPCLLFAFAPCVTVDDEIPSSHWMTELETRPASMTFSQEVLLLPIFPESAPEVLRWRYCNVGCL